MELYPVVLAGRPHDACGEVPRWLDVSRKNWPVLLELGVGFGWQQLGTVPDTGRPFPFNSRPSHCGEHVPSYDVNFAECAKCVTTDDAVRWADALEKALRGEGNIDQRRRWTSALSGDIVPEPQISAEDIVCRFVAFLRLGAFAFYCTD